MISSQCFYKISNLLFVHFSSNKDFLFANILSLEASYNIPKTIHFVWIGKPIEEKYIKNIQTLLMNRDYEVFD